MLTDLKRCNSVGSVTGILFLLSIISHKDSISKEEIRNRCSLENGVTVNCPGAVAFLEYIGLITTEADRVIPTDSLNKLPETQEEIIKKLVDLCINQLVNDGIFDNDVIGFDSNNGFLTIKRSAFPLTHAAIRNFLINVGALGNGENDAICVEDNYEKDWVLKLRTRRKKFSIEQLLKTQEEQNRRGLEAEEFVVKLEKERLPKRASKIKRISDFDVSAGYDIVSYDNDNSEHYDRFIEVKCYLGSPHFYWSANERDVAQIRSDKYILCLVDYLRINEPGYRPEFIMNPYRTIFENEIWMVTPASYYVQKI